MREGGVALALRVAEGEDGVRGGVTPAELEMPAAVRPFPFTMRRSLLIAEDAAEEFVLTKRRSCAS